MRRKDVKNCDFILENYIGHSFNNRHSQKLYIQCPTVLVDFADAFRYIQDLYCLEKRFNCKKK